MPKSHTRNHRILPSKSVNARRAADHNRKLNVVDHNQFVIRSLKSVNTKTPQAKHSHGDQLERLLAETPKVLAPGMYNLGSKYIPPPKRANWSNQPRYLRTSKLLFRNPTGL
ncbi:hypothetical protein Tco_1313229 [Tanacetum coccineum]